MGRELATAGVSNRGKVALLPDTTETLVGPLAAKVKSIPCPVSCTVCRAVLLAMVTAPERAPADLGTNATFNVHAPPTGTTAPDVQLPASATTAKSPVVAMAPRLSGAVPLLVSVTTWAEVATPTPVAAKASAPGATVTPAPATAEPARLTNCAC